MLQKKKKKRKKERKKERKNKASHVIAWDIVYTKSQLLPKQLPLKYYNNI